MLALVIAAATALGPVTSAHSTAYCLRGRMADGTYVRWGSVAMNRHPLGTLIWLTRPVNGRRYFRVRDRIGYGSELDIWMPSCSDARRYGRRVRYYRVVRGR